MVCVKSERNPFPLRGFVPHFKGGPDCLSIKVPQPRQKNVRGFGMSEEFSQAAGSEANRLDLTDSE